LGFHNDKTRSIAMEIFPNPVATVGAQVPGLMQATAALKMSVSPLLAPWEMGEGSLNGLGAYDIWRTTGVGQAMPGAGVAAGIGGATAAIMLSMAAVGVIVGGMHGYQRHKGKGAWPWVWGIAGAVFPGPTVTAAIAQRQVSGWKRGR
jgi:hypothetical protein